MYRREQALRVHVYFDEDDTWHGRPLQAALLERLIHAGCLGATVLRGVAGFGPTGEVHLGGIEVLAAELPLVLQWVDHPERVERLLPELLEMIGDRLVTIEPVEVAHYPRQEPHQVSGERRVAEVITRNPVAVSPATPLSELVRLLVGREYRALPVVDADQHVVGIVTSSDLVERGGAPLRLELLGALSPDALATELQALEAAGRSAADVMTREVVTVQPETDLATAAHLMVTRGLKRMPVVDAEGRLVGMLSRFDILRSLVDGAPHPAPEPAGPAAPASARVAAVMSRDVARVGPDAPLPELLDAVVASPLNCAVVTDSAGRPLGLVTDAELLRRLSPADQPSAVRVLMSKLPFVHQTPETQARLCQATGSCARDLMIAPVATVSEDEPVRSAARRMLEARPPIKLMPVVDADGRLVGLVDREALLRAILLG